MFRSRLWMLAPALLLAACGQQATPTATGSEDVPWSYTALEGQLTALALDPGPNTLSFEPLLSATNGYGPFETDRSNGEAAAGDGKPITLNGVVYAKGLGVHSNGSLVYSLTNFKGATCSTFTASIGVDDEVGSRGSVRFQVLTGATPGTATQVYDSGVMTGSSATKTVTVDVSTSKVLVLRVTDAGDGNFYDHADWAVPTINCVAAARPKAGTLDNGYTTTASTITVKDTVMQADGKLVQFGNYADTPNGARIFFVRRLDQDGNIDLNFGTPGQNGYLTFGTQIGAPNDLNKF
jgi:NPCBM/NEW2 domain